MLEHRRGLEPETERAERAGVRHATPRYQPKLRDNSRMRACAVTDPCCPKEQTSMSTITRTEAEEWKYAEKSLTWYGWGSPIGLGAFLIAIGVFLLLIYHAGLIR
jgi:hypothetical protein